MKLYALLSVLCTVNCDYEEYTNWAKKYNKVMSNESYTIFLESYELVKNHDATKLFQVELNEFADISPVSNKIMNSNIDYDFQLEDEDLIEKCFDCPEEDNLPKEFSWVSKGAVTEVSNQLSCGGCYAFSAAESLEGQYFLKTGKLVKFSKSQLVDCSTDYGNYKCQGGLQSNCFKYLEKYGAMSEEDYPYVPKGEKCKYNESKVVTMVKSYKTVNTFFSSIKSVLYSKGPLSVSLDASQRDFQLYSGGVYHSDKCSNVADHAVLLVGWGTENDTDYWLLKNSWGKGFGGIMRGFVKISMDLDCGISENVISYPIL